jgi:phosphotransferase system IIB component
MRLQILLSLLTLGFSAQLLFAQSALDTAKIEQIIGVKGTMIPDENVFKVGKARNDVKVEVDGWSMPPFMGLGSWAAFTPSAHGVMVMGDTVLFEDEVNPVMSVALDSGLEVTALHNHFFFDQPKVFFMHIGGIGEADKLAAGVKNVWDKIAQIRAANPMPAKSFGAPNIGPENAISAAPLETILGVKGQSQQGMFKVVIGRPASMHGTPIGKEMGVNTWAAFAGKDAEAVIDGDFAMTENELQTVLKAMRKEGINIVAIHHHMSGEEPRILFLHYWGKGEAAQLAQAFKHVLDAQAAVKKHAEMK